MIENLMLEKAKVTEWFILKTLKENNIKKIPNKFVSINEQDESIWLTYKNKRLNGTLTFNFDKKNLKMTVKVTN